MFPGHHLMSPLAYLLLDKDMTYPKVCPAASMVLTTNFLPNSPSNFPGKIKMSSLGTSKGVLEIAKFGLYVTIPIVLMYTFANNTKNLQKFMGNVYSLLSLLLFVLYLFSFQIFSWSDLSDSLNSVTD